MKKYLYIVFIFVNANFLFAQDGSLDPTFGIGGKVHTDMAASQDHGNAVCLQSDGKIILAGNTKIGATSDIVVLRYNPDGSLDTNFSDDGIAIIFFEGEETAKAVLMQDDEKILVAGYTTNGVKNDFVLMRLQRDGSIDYLFGDNGIVVTNLVGNSDKANAILLQPDGKILAAGQKRNGSGLYEDMALVRYNYDGSIDSAFATNGHSYIDMGYTKDFGLAMAKQADGKLIIAGYSSFAGNESIALVRYNSDGSIDSTFNNDGRVKTDITSLDEEAHSVIIQGDGKIIITGFTDSGTDQDFVTIRYTINGDLDTTFGAGGIVKTDGGGDFEVGNQVMQQADGKILVAGFGVVGSSKDFVIIRYNADGSLDNTFDGDGFATTNFVNFSDEVYAGLIQPDSKILVVGQNHNGANYDFALARYMVSGVGINEHIAVKGNLTLYPNPATNMIQVQSQKAFTNSSLRIINSTGQIILQQQNISGNNFSFDVSGFSNGIYFLQVTEKETVQQIKFVKQ